MQNDSVKSLIAKLDEGLLKVLSAWEGSPNTAETHRAIGMQGVKFLMSHCEYPESISIHIAPTAEDSCALEPDNFYTAILMAGLDTPPWPSMLHGLKEWEGENAIYYYDRTVIKCEVNGDIVSRKFSFEPKHIIHQSKINI